MSILGDRLALALSSLDHIAARLSASLAENDGTFPVSAATVRSTDGRAAVERDAFLQRFQQVSDHVLRKLFPRILAAIQGTSDFVAMRDVLDGLHRAHLIDEPGIWLTVLELRNRLIHEYALSEAELAQDINAAWAVAPVLLGQIQRIRTYALHHDLLDGASL